uniref:Uncharacterized protein n=1 Tax=Corethron hystrix TaxID=216773 RepID=A0A7S1BKK2_9STRA|mmetsp:Transcript_30062/g.68916  ORF Transcript_30062/g.68916 Transcript_30062/m.68916 type:complete len:269 (+) Transcript_30062:375-1181(+)|eukprot:CAMPEP_0113304524 /NCGR_PEP_ID=MMETSP0010_2-20120614/4509_1 /TAXON_ID=216773 ORGANISM="Corethron hystrix, Strain 308" /NCGR_SAMPLE_ID=MMETSP0010_2 /ASSEMBLY_ACC=CAM_ASM_000155 /LENGTH=268 /DNA_ID=CAMNT_0000158745 /DNA_START=224 /DNA_END=1030 /DNA_ORIENTATION=- /assembly_acc=CAM_ASM_000155
MNNHAQPVNENCIDHSVLICNIIFGEINPLDEIDLEMKCQKFLIGAFGYQHCPQTCNSCDETGSSMDGTNQAALRLRNNESQYTGNKLDRVTNSKDISVVVSATASFIGGMIFMSLIFFARKRLNRPIELGALSSSSCEEKKERKACENLVEETKTSVKRNDSVTGAKEVFKNDLQDSEGTFKHIRENFEHFLLYETSSDSKAIVTEGLVNDERNKNTSFLTNEELDDAAFSCDWNGGLSVGASSEVTVSTNDEEMGHISPRETLLDL